MQGSRLGFMKRKEVKHTAKRVGVKGEQLQGAERKSKRRRRMSDGGGRGGAVDMGWNNIMAHRYATYTVNVSPAVCI